jgi:hypothetical protein
MKNFFILSLKYVINKIKTGNTKIQILKILMN